MGSSGARLRDHEVQSINPCWAQRRKRERRQMGRWDAPPTQPRCQCSIQVSPQKLESESHVYPMA
jgi:hypothetical protein